MTKNNLEVKVKHENGIVDLALDGNPEANYTLYFQDSGPHVNVIGAFTKPLQTPEEYGALIQKAGEIIQARATTTKKKHIHEEYFHDERELIAVGAIMLERGYGRVQEDGVEFEFVREYKPQTKVD